MQKYWAAFATSNYMRIDKNTSNRCSLVLNVNIEKFISFIKQRWCFSLLVRPLFRKELIYILKNIELFKKLISSLQVTTPGVTISTSYNILQWYINDFLLNNEIITTIEVLLLCYYSHKPKVPPNINDIKNFISRSKT